MQSIDALPQFYLLQFEKLNHLHGRRLQRAPLRPKIQIVYLVRLNRGSLADEELFENR